MQITKSKKWFGLMILAVILVLAAPVFHAEETLPPTDAAELTGQMTVSAPWSQNASWALADNNRVSSIKVPNGETVTVTSPEPFHSVYLIWDRTPESWQVISNGRTLDQSENSFLHHYIELPEASTEIQIVAGGENGVLCDVHLFTEGALPDWVQRWEPPYERADLLVFPTHADDEHLFFGGTMPYYATERDYRVQVAYLTNHNGEPYRPHELLNGLWTVGIRAYPIISDFPDYYSESLEHAKTIYSEEEILGYQTELVRRFKPYVIVGHDVKGEYGHGVHQLNAYGLSVIADKTGDPEWYPESAEKYGVWELPKLYLHLYPENQVVMNWDVPLDDFGGKTAYQVACDGFACHVSQQVFQMAHTGAFDSTRFGLVHSTVGPDVSKDDFFENIVFEDETPPATPEPSTVPEEPAGTPEPTGEPEPMIVRENPMMKPLLLAAAVLLAAVLLLLAVRAHNKKRRRNRTTKR